MAIVTNVLFPVDFSERCVGAARYVEAIVGRFQAKLTLLHVMADAHTVFAVPEFSGAQTWKEIQEHWKSHAQAQMDAFLVDELKYYDVKRVVEVGDAARQIVEYAHKERVDLIMLPSHGVGPFRRFVLGSVTAKVLHDTHCPVWTGVHMEGAPPLEQIHCKSIVCAVDLGGQSHDALSWAAKIAAEYGAKLTVAHAVPLVQSRPAAYMDLELFTSLVTTARTDIDELVQRVGAQPKVRIEGGDPANVVRQVAEEEAADMVVIGRGSASGGLGRLRSHAYAVIRTSPCPVVSV
jgi:nucleotide-binding universal stress UspA family protein